MNRMITLLIFCFLSASLGAQIINEMVAFSHRDYLYWNPAAIAIDGRPSIGVLYKDVNVGLEKAPAFMGINYQFPVRFQHSAFSATLSKDLLGDLRQNKLSLGYRYSLFNHRLDDQRLYVGLSTDFKHDRLLGANLNPRDIDDPLINDENQKDLSLDINMGVFYQILLPSAFANGDQKISAGLSMNRLLAKDAVFADTLGRINRPRQVFGLAAYELDFGGYDLEAKYFMSAGGLGSTHTLLVGVKNISFMSFYLGYSTTKDLLINWGFSMTDFNDSALEVDLSLYYGLGELINENRSGMQIALRYLFEPKPWTTSDFR